MVTRIHSKRCRGTKELLRPRIRRDDVKEAASKTMTAVWDGVKIGWKVDMVAKLAVDMDSREMLER